MRKSKAATLPANPVPAAAVPVAAVPASAPVNVIVVVETRRRARRKQDAKHDDGQGHPVVKGIAGLAIVKRLTRRRKRPLRARVRKAAKRGRKRLRKTARRVRKALR